MTSLAPALPISSEILGLFLLHSLWQDTILAALLAVCLIVTRGRSSQFRYLLACVALMAMLVLPLATAIGFTPAETPISGRESVNTEASSPGSASLSSFKLRLRHFSQGVSNSSSISNVARLAEKISPFCVLGWEAGVLLLSLKIFRDWLWIRRLRANCSPVGSELQRRVSELAGKMGIRSVPDVLESDCVHCPSALGWLKTSILLPLSFQSGLSQEALEALIVHELAHIRRHDYVVNLIQTAIETALFFHPAVWWVSNQIRKEREHCCDDLAVASLGEKVPYLRALVSLEESTSFSGTLAMSARGGELLKRVRRLAGAKPEGLKTFEWASLFPLAVIALLLGIVVLSPRPAFGRKSPPVAGISSKPAHEMARVSPEEEKQSLRILLQEDEPATEDRRMPTPESPGSNIAPPLNATSKRDRKSDRDSSIDPEATLLASLGDLKIDLGDEARKEIRKSMKEATAEMKKAGFSASQSDRILSKSLQSALKDALKSTTESVSASQKPGGFSD